MRVLPERGLRFQIRLPDGWSRTFRVTRVLWLSVYFRADGDRQHRDRRIGVGEWCRRAAAAKLQVMERPRGAAVGPGR